jgi:hypothetical protein
MGDFNQEENTMSVEMKQTIKELYERIHPLKEYL